MKQGTYRHKALPFQHLIDPSEFYCIISSSPGAIPQLPGVEGRAGGEGEVKGSGKCRG